MKSVLFNKENGVNSFSFDGSDIIDSFEYKPSIANLWDNLDKKDFVVELLINPLLNRESDIFDLRNNDNKRVGYIFPVSVLDTEMDLSPYRHIENYIYIAFWELLERLEVIKTNANYLSDCFEDNVSIIVLHKETIGTPNPLHLFIHTLRRYSYSYFEPNNSIKPIEGYNNPLIGKHHIIIALDEPPLYHHEVVDVILRTLPKADDIAHRIILLYQVIEYLFEITASYEINSKINKYQNRLSSENDFIESIRNIASERTRIHLIFDKCQNIKESSNNFNDACLHLFELIHYVPDKTEISDIFYSFRNQFVHSYRKMLHYKKELAETVQCFEILVLDIIQNYKE